MAPRHEPPQLEPITTAILSATHERLQDTLIDLVTKDKHTRELLEKALLVPEAAPTTGGNDCLPLPEVNVDAPASTKRKRYEMCEQCHKEFDTTKNSSDACVWHSGDLEVDVYGDFWADHDEDCHGKIDTEEMRKEFPDGFIWEGCCEQKGSAKGCEVSEHVAASFTAKKRRS